MTNREAAAEEKWNQARRDAVRVCQQRYLGMYSIDDAVMLSAQKGFDLSTDHATGIILRYRKALEEILQIGTGPNLGYGRVLNHQAKIAREALGES